MRKPGAEDVRRAVRKTSKKVPRGAGEGTSTTPSMLKRLYIGEAAPSVPKKPRTDKEVSSSSERGALVTPDECGEAPLTGGIIDLMASPSFHPGRAEVDQGAPTRPSAMAGPSDQGLSRPSSSAQIPVGEGGRGLTEAESLGGGTAFEDPTIAIFLFSDILLPADATEMSECSLSEIANSMFPALTWVSRPTLLFSFHCSSVDF